MNVALHAPPLAGCGPPGVFLCTRGSGSLARTPSGQFFQAFSVGSGHLAGGFQGVKGGGGNFSTAEKPCGWRTSNRRGARTSNFIAPGTLSPAPDTSRSTHGQAAKERNEGRTLHVARRNGRAGAVPWNQKWILGSLLVLITLISYQQTWHIGYIWDDNFHVTGNPTLRDLHGLWRIWSEVAATPQYYPLVHTSFWLDTIYGVESAGLSRSQRFVAHARRHSALASITRTTSARRMVGRRFSRCIRWKWNQWHGSPSARMSSRRFFILRRHWPICVWWRWITREIPVDAAGLCISHRWFLFVCALLQDRGVFVAGGAAAGALVEDRPVETAGRSAVAAVFCNWSRPGIVHRLD